MYHRKSIRLRGYDYSEPGDYVVTICTEQRRCVLGGGTDMRFCPSEIGGVVQHCFNNSETTRTLVRRASAEVSTYHSGLTGFKLCARGKPR